MHRPLRLSCSKDALTANWKWLSQQAGSRCGAAIKADGYGLGVRRVVDTLLLAGCRDFFVSSWWEAEEIGALPPDASMSVLHGLGPDDKPMARAGVRPVLNSVSQVARWKEMARGQPCDVMIDTGMNRLGLRPEEAGALAGLTIETLHSHLACADEDREMNRQQLERFRMAATEIAANAYSLANSAGVLLGRDYSFDLVRPGLALYGGVPRAEARGHIQQVARLEAQVVQRRTIHAGESCGYNATFSAERSAEAAIINIGYADGYVRSLSGVGTASFGDASLPVLGRVSMDLVALGCDACPELIEGDWVSLEFDLENVAQRSERSQYELLTGLGNRFERRWT